MLLALALLTSLLTDQPLLPNPQGNKAIPDYFKNNQIGRGQVTICNLNGQDMRGQFKICRYDCGTEITIDKRVVCPFIMQR